jgi:hypothetical protein
MLTRFVLNSIWRNKGLALAALAYYLFAEGKKKESPNAEAVHSSSSGSSGRRPRSRK